MRSRTHRLHLAWIAFLLALSSVLSAQAPAPQKASKKQVLMWKVSSPTGSAYLLGSIHVGTPEMYPLPGGIEKAFASSQALVVEVNINNMSPATAMDLIQKFGMYSGDDSLARHISKEDSAVLDRFCTDHSMPRQIMDKFKPWVAAITVLAAGLKEAGLDTSLGIDKHFLDEVKPPQQIKELETAEFQMSVLASGSDQEQQQLLSDTLKQVSRFKDLLNKIETAYFSGDADSLLNLTREEQAGPESLMKRLVDDRNVTMAQKIEEMLKTGNQYFVVVGALHIIGEKGIASLLRSRGYKVDQMVVTAE